MSDKKYSKNLTKRFTVRWQKIDFVFVSKRSKELKITVSEYLRRLIENERIKFEKENAKS